MTAAATLCDWQPVKGGVAYDGNGKKGETKFRLVFFKSLVITLVEVWLLS